MANIIEAINKIGDEVDSSLEKRNHGKYFMLTILLFSLTENLLKWMVATKISWDESCRQTDLELEQGENYKDTSDIKGLRDQVKNSTFNNVINQALKLHIIPDALASRLHKIRKERNDLVHQLWLFEHRDNEEILEKKLRELKGVALKLIKHFNRLHYEEIGVDIPEVEETL